MGHRGQGDCELKASLGFIRETQPQAEWKRKRNNSKEKVFNYRTLSGWLVNDRRRREVCIKPHVSEFCKATCLYIHKLVWDHSIELVLLQPMKETGSQIMHLGELSLHRLSLSRPDSCTLCPKGLYLQCLSRHSTLLLPKCPPQSCPLHGHHQL